MPERPEPVIRPADERDIPVIRALFRQGDRYHAELLPVVFQYVGDGRTDEYVRSFMTDGSSGLIVAELGGDVVGFLTVKRMSSQDLPFFRKAEYALLDWCVVDADHRRRGIGTALFHAARRWAQERGLRSIQLMVWADNKAARELYAKFGFRDLIGKMELKL